MIKKIKIKKKDIHVTSLSSETIFGQPKAIITVRENVLENEMIFSSGSFVIGQGNAKT